MGSPKSWGNSGRGRGRESGNYTISGLGYGQNRSSYNNNSTGKPKQSTSLKFQIHGHKIK